MHLLAPGQVLGPGSVELILYRLEYTCTYTCTTHVHMRVYTVYYCNRYTLTEAQSDFHTDTRVSWWYSAKSPHCFRAVPCIWSLPTNVTKSEVLVAVGQVHVVVSATPCTTCRVRDACVRSKQGTAGAFRNPARACVYHVLVFDSYCRLHEEVAVAE